MNDTKKDESLEMEDWTEKKSKKWVILFSILGLVVALLGAYYTYFYIYLNTEKYLDNITENLKSSLGKMFANEKNNSIKVDLEKDELLTGNIQLKSNENSLVDLALDIKSSAKKELAAIDLSINANNASLNGGLYFQDKQLYLESNDFYNGILSIDMEENLTKNQESMEDLNELIKNPQETIQYALEKLIEYHLEALKEGKLSTSPSGINKKEYKIVIGATEKVAIERRLDDLIKKDERLSKLIEKYNIEYNLIQAGTYIFTVDVFTNEIKEIQIITDEYEIKGKYDGEKFILKEDEATYAYIWMNDNEIRIEDYENNKHVGDLLINKEEVRFSYEDVYLSIQTKDKQMKAELNTKDVKLSLEIETEVINETSHIKGNGSLISDGQNYGIAFDFSYKVEDNLISKKEITNAKKIDELTEAEQQEIAINLYELLDKFGLSQQDLL